MSMFPVAACIISRFFFFFTTSCYVVSLDLRYISALFRDALRSFSPFFPTRFPTRSYDSLCYFAMHVNNLELE